ncbi:MAG: PilZ domain-containing protein [Sphingomicrobium sp.]
MAELPSVTTFVMGADLPWPDETRLIAEKGRYEPGAVYRAGERSECEIRRIAAGGATLRGQLADAAGEDLSVELGGGQRAAGTVEWLERGETGVRFKQPVDVLALINRQLINQPTERRAMPRVEIRCAAHVRFGGSFWPSTLRNISAGGLQIEGDPLPDRGTFVSVFVDGLVLPAGEVKWRKDALAGVQLMEEVSWTSIIPWIRGLSRG